MEADDTDRIDFDPTASIPPLHDANPDGIPDDELRAALEQLVTTKLRPWSSDDHARDRVLAAYAAAHAHYRLDVVFPDDSVGWYSFDFAGDSVDLAAGQASPPEADQVHRISASALVGWVRRTRSFFSVRASSRRFGATRQLRRGAVGVRVEPRPLPDLLLYYVLQVTEGSDLSAKHEVDHRLRVLREHAAG